MLDRTAARPPRQRVDRCPGVLRPWPAEDGALVRVRLVGGRLTAQALGRLVALSRAYADGDLHLTARANVQLRGVRTVDGHPHPDFVADVRDAGLLPSADHDLARNVMVSPLSGRVGGRADLRPVARELDRLLLADPDCAGLSGRFLFVLDDGRGDLLGRTADLAAVALGAGTVQLRAGAAQWGPVVPVAEAARELHALTRRFIALRGRGATAAWHVEELEGPLLPVLHDRHPDVPAAAARPAEPAFGGHRQDDGRTLEHVAVPDGRLTPDQAAEVLARARDEVLVTPWRSLLLPDLEAT